MTWRDDLQPEQQDRLRQIECYQGLYGYEADSDMFLLCLIAEIADTKEWLAIQRGNIDNFLRDNGYDPDEIAEWARRVAREAAGDNPPGLE